MATRFQFRLHEVDKAVGGMLILPATPEVIAGFIAEAEAAPEELSTIANVMPAPPMPFLPAESRGKLVVLAILVYAGQVEAGERALAPFRALAAPFVDMLHPMRYPEVYPPEESEYHPTAIGHTMFLDTIDRDVAETIIDYLQSSDATIRVAQLRVLGGAMARVPVEATAFAHRRSRIMVNLAAFTRTRGPGCTQSLGGGFRRGRTTGRLRRVRGLPGRRGRAARVREATRDRPGTGWRPLRRAMIRPTCSASTKISRQRVRA